MGGSGGGGGHISRREMDIGELLDRSRDKSDLSAYESEVNDTLQDKLTGFNERDVDAIHRHLEQLAKTIQDSIEGTIDLLFGGSTIKHTYVDGLSDTDALVCLNAEEYRDQSPHDLLAHFASVIQQRLPDTTVSVGDLSISIEYVDGHKIQLLPAIREGTGLRIPDMQSKNWSRIVRPDAFASKLTEMNNQHNSMIVPVIKLFKGAQSNLPSEVQMTGYHVESLAIQAFEGYEGRHTYKDMLTHMLRSATDAVITPITDRSGQSLYVDEYLGAANCSLRLRMAESMKRMLLKIEAANSKHDHKAWESLFSER
jgi:hypothetical protein